MFKLLRKDNKGFTLVELLVVIAVIGILAAIAIPRFGGFTDRALEASHKSELQQVRQSISYALIEGDTFSLTDLERYLGAELTVDVDEVNGTYTPGDGGRDYTLSYKAGADEVEAHILAVVEEDNGKTFTYKITSGKIELQ